ncbi:hypothetical protein [Nonomuraea sp. NPDC049141]|uniref:hypothetical protein n=1 Tax=Nonomuraea sp. NPDC049141 TaxID=3155500 RepID=UPI0033EBE285
MAETWQDDGVNADGPWQTDLQVFSNNEPFTLYVRPGRAFVSGFHYYLDSQASLTFEGNTASQTRYDLIVLRVNRSANRVELGIRKGTPGGAVPTPDRSWETREFPLARISLPANATSVQAGSVEDYREFKGKRVRTFVNGSTSAIPEGSLYYSTFSKRFFAMFASDVAQALALRNEVPFLVTSTTRPTSGSTNGSFIYETDTRRAYVYSGGDWRLIGKEETSDPFAVLKLSSAAPVVANTPQFAVPWNTELIDNKNGHSNSVEPWKYTVQQSGWYQLVANIGGTCTATTSSVEVQFRKNESVSVDDCPGNVKAMANGNPLYLSTTSFLYLTVGDYVRVEVDNSTAQTYAIYPGSLFSVRWVAP